MKAVPIRALAALLSLAFAGAAQAQTFSDLHVVPDPAPAGSPVSLAFRWAGCTPDGDEPTVSVEGSVVTVGVRYGTICGTPPPPVDVTVPLGRFAAGDYIARFAGVPIDGVGIPIADPPIDVPFRVTGSAGVDPFAAPVGGGAAALALGGLLMLLAGRRLRSRA